MWDPGLPALRSRTPSILQGTALSGKLSRSPYRGARTSAPPAHPGGRAPPGHLIALLLRLESRNQFVVGVRQRVEAVLLRVALDVGGGSLVLSDGADVVPVGVALEGGYALAGVQ